MVHVVRPRDAGDCTDLSRVRFNILVAYDMAQCLDLTVAKADLACGDKPMILLQDFEELQLVLDILCPGTPASEQIINKSTAVLHSIFIKESGDGVLKERRGVL